MNNRINKILKSKKGIAMESAVVFMIASSALCFLLITLSLIGRHQIKIQDSLNDKKLERTIIGEDFMAYIDSVTVQKPPESESETPPAQGDESVQEGEENEQIPLDEEPQSFAEFYLSSIRNEIESIIYNGKYYFTDTKTLDEETYVTTFELSVTYSNNEEVFLYIKAEKNSEGQITPLAYLSCAPAGE